MGDKITHLTSESFDDFSSQGNVVIDFWAEWCGPCKILGPQFEAASKEFSEARFAKVDVDENQDIAERFQVMSIPTLIFLKDGEVVNRVSGAMPKEEIISLARDSF